MDFPALFHIFQSWGPSAISSCLVVVVLYLIKKVDAAGKANAVRSEELQKQFDAKISGVREQFSVRFQELRQYMENVSADHGRRLSYIETEYTRNDSFFRELSGWRGEINRVSDQVTALHTFVSQSFIQVLHQGEK